MSLPRRNEIRPGLRVQIVEKQNQRTGALTEGTVARILTSSSSHPHGIKVMLENGKVGRVKTIVNIGGTDVLTRVNFQEEQSQLLPPKGGSLETRLKVA